VPKAFSLRGSIPAVLAEMADALAGVFLPAGRRLCEKVLITASRLPICDECPGSFALIGERICSRCGLPLDAFAVEPTERGQEAEGELRCGRCRMDAYHFDRARSVFRYEDAVVRAIVMLKFEEMGPLADWFAGWLARRVSGEAAYAGSDAVVPVPLHKDPAAGARL
jgi:predicted amidophosphoribosyltransferase